jgi:PAP_fibrillin
VLNGDWQLVYSDASEITRLAKLPFGFCLGPVFQSIHVAEGRLENQAYIQHRLRLLSGHTRVLANFSLLAPMGATNRVGIVNIGNRANVVFTKVIFTLRRLWLLPTFGKIRKTAVPNGPSEQVGLIPCIDVTFLDNDLRISRGGDGSLFILTRPTNKGKRMLPILPVEVAKRISVDPEAPTYDASVDTLPSGSRDRS